MSTENTYPVRSAFERRDDATGRFVRYDPSGELFGAEAHTSITLNAEDAQSLLDEGLIGEAGSPATESRPGPVNRRRGAQNNEEN